MRDVPLLLCLSLLLGLAGCQAQPSPIWEAGSGQVMPTRINLRLDGKAQERSLSCESRSACDLLTYYGRAMPEDSFRTGIPLSDNPDLGFVGDVNGPGGQLPPAGYGVHAEPIASRLRAVGLPSEAYRARDLAWLKRELAEGKPVIVWATSQLNAPRPVSMNDRRGRSFTAVPGEHTFLAVGYAPGLILLVDSATGREREVFLRTFDASWASLGRQAVVPDQAPDRRRPSR